jgi:hypothetical protein
VVPAETVRSQTLTDRVSERIAHPAKPDFPFHENGEPSRHLPGGDQAAASRQIQQRNESPVFVW